MSAGLRLTSFKRDDLVRVLNDAFEAMLGTGANVVVYPGGLDEANDDTASSAIAIRTRKGFVRLALATDAPEVRDAVAAKACVAVRRTETKARRRSIGGK